VPDVHEKHSALRFTADGAQLEQLETHWPFELRIEES
jgi:hypothetical protein